MIGHGLARAALLASVAGCLGGPAGAQHQQASDVSACPPLRMFVVRSGSVDGWPQAPLTMGPLTSVTRWSVVLT
jgi:hypothetical protein